MTSMHHRLALALTPYIHHGIAAPEEAATRVLEEMREPTEGMCYGPHWQEDDGHIETWRGMIDAALKGA